MNRDRLLLVLIILVVASVFLTPIRRDLFVGDETKYGRILWEMRAGGSLLVPTLEGRPYSHKPPVHFWLVYLLTFIFGPQSIWAFVLPSLIAFVLMLFLIRKVAVELFGGSGLLPVFIFSTFYLAWGIAQTARMDLSFVLLITFAVLYLHRFFQAERSQDLIVAAILVGVAILVKGPMALVIVTTLLLIEALRRRRWPRGNYLLALILAAGIPLAWLLPALRAGGREYTREIVLTQNLGRAFRAWVHREPPWWYVQRFPATFFPWFLLAIVALIAVYRTRDDNARFCASWFFAVLIPFSLLSGKLDVYMIPALVPIALICGQFVRAAPAGRLREVAIVGNRLILLLVALVCLSVPLLAPRFVHQLPELALMSRPIVAGLFWSSAAVAVAALIYQVIPSDAPLDRSVIPLGVGAIYPLVYLAVFLMPVVNDNTSTRPLVRALMRQTLDGKKIALWTSPHLWTPEMPPSYRDVEYIGRDRLRQSGPKPLVIATRSDRAHHLGRELLEQYRKVDQFRMRGKSFDVYRRR